MKRLYICSVLGLGSDKIDSFQVPDDLLSSFVEVVMCSDFKLLISDVVDYDR